MNPSTNCNQNVTAGGAGARASQGGNDGSNAKYGIYDNFHLKIRGFHLKNLGGLVGTSDPFYEISCQSESAVGSTIWHPIYRSKHVDDNLYPIWDEASIPIAKLSSGGGGGGATTTSNVRTSNALGDGDPMNRIIQINVYDYNRNGKHFFMGSLQTTLNTLMAAKIDQSKIPAGKDKKSCKMIDTSKAFLLKKKGKNKKLPAEEVGKIIVTMAQIKKGEPPEKSGPARILRNVPDLIPTDAMGSIRINDTNNNQKSPSSLPSSPSAMPLNQQSSQRPVQSSTGPQLPHPEDTVTCVDESESEVEISPTDMFGELPPPMPVPDTDKRDLRNHYAQSSSPSAAAAGGWKSNANLRPHFLDYITGGLELSLHIAIDFTGSNGDPRIPGTLHYIHNDGHIMNDYEKAITAVGEIIARYDSDQKFPVFGFGAKYGGQIQHCFQVGANAECSGVSEVLAAYRNTFHSGLVMSGPTVFADVINYSAKKARESSQITGKQAYTVLLILTDGAVTDMGTTQQSIINASDAPLSIVIVGIGNADFSRMQYLDDFSDPQMNMGGVGQFQMRDIVQFVQFSRHENSKIALTRETLDEIPNQLVDYFYQRNIMPQEPTTKGSQRFKLIADDFNSEQDIDLNVQIDSEGEISLENSSAAMIYDDHQYGNLSNFMNNDPSSQPASQQHQFQQQQAFNPAAAASGPQHQQPPFNPAVPPSQGGGGGGGFNPYYQQQQLQQQGSQSAFYNNSNAAAMQMQQQQQSFYNNQNAMMQHQQQNASQRYGVGSRGQQQQPMAQQPPNIFHVQVPPGVSAGMQLQIQNPFNGDTLIVAVPPGVPPGGKFAVMG